MNDTPPGCNDTKTEIKPNGDCGNSGLAIVYLVTYLVMTFLVIINMYIAVILENFSQVGRPPSVRSKGPNFPRGLLTALLRTSHSPHHPRRQ